MAKRDGHSLDHHSISGDGAIGVGVGIGIGIDKTDGKSTPTPTPTTHPLTHYKVPVMLRPRRFGKSLWCSILELPIIMSGLELLTAFCQHPPCA